jgi:hypothetical protein
MIPLKDLERGLPRAYRDRLEAGGRADFQMASFVWSPLAASATNVSQTLRNDMEADLLVLGAVRVVTDATFIATPAVAPITLEANLGENAGRTFAPAGTHLDNFAGTAQRPAVFPMPMIIPGGNGLVITLTNLSATAYYVRLGLLTVRLYN